MGINWPRRRRKWLTELRAALKSTPPVMTDYRKTEYVFEMMKESTVDLGRIKGIEATEPRKAVYSDDEMPRTGLLHTGKAATRLTHKFEDTVKGIVSHDIFGIRVDTREEKKSK